MKRLFFDIEVSQAVVKAWRVGYKINITPDRIVRHAAIICISWKWQGEKKIHHVQWDNGCDKELLIEFCKAADQADEICGHNSNNFDCKWITGRCVYHQIDMFPDWKQVDTLLLARRHKFPSNKLDELAKYFGVGQKYKHSGISMWDAVEDATNADATPKMKKEGKAAMKEMLHYCDIDVDVLEKVYDRLSRYAKVKTHIGVMEGSDKWSCPRCGVENVHKKGVIVLASGYKRQRWRCMNSTCGHQYRTSMKAALDHFEETHRKDKL